MTGRLLILVAGLAALAYTASCYKRRLARRTRVWQRAHAADRETRLVAVVSPQVADDFPEWVRRVDGGGSDAA